MTHNTVGIVLKKQFFSENSLLYTVFTRESGKITAFVQAARKIRSKLRPHLEFFGESELMLATGKNVEHLAGANLILSFKNIKSSLEKINAALYCLDILDQLTRLNQKDEKVYNLLRRTLLAFGSKEATVEKLIQKFISELMALLGYKSELLECEFCHRKIIPGGYALDLLNLSGDKLLCAGCK